MKTVLKIVYIAVVLVAAVIMYFGFYSSFASSNYTDLLTKAIKTADKTADYDDIARAFSIFSTPLEDEPAVLEKTSDSENITFIYQSVNRHTLEYTEGDTKKSIDKIDNIYLITILHPTFQRMNTSGTNQACFRFYGDGTKENEYYDYLFTITSKVNSSEYSKKPTSEKDAALHGERTLLETYKSFDLIFFPLTETTAGFIEESIGSIKGFNIIDNAGNGVYSSKVDYNFDYTGEFYTDLSGFVSNYNIYLNNKNGVQEYEEEVVKEATKFVEGFTKNPEEYVANFKTKYIQGYAYGDVYTGTSMVMKTLGIDFLFIFAAALIFILVFHLKWIKKFVARFSKNATEPQRVVPNRAPQSQIVISKSKAKPVEAKPEEVKTETVVEVKEEAKPEVEEDEKSEEPEVKEEAPLEKDATEDKEE